MGDLGVTTPIWEDEAAKAFEQDLVESGSTLSSCGATVASMPGESSAKLAPTDNRYRAFLDVSRTIAQQPSLHAVLHSLRDVLSSSCRLHGAHLYVLGNDGESLHLLEFDRETDAPAIKIGTKISRIGAAAQVLEGLEPVFIADVSQEMLKHPELAAFAAESAGRGTFVFPVSTSQQRYGILVVTKERGQ